MDQTRPSARELGRIFEQQYPAIQWRTGLPVASGDVKKIVCRYCLAAYGLKASNLETTPFAFDDATGFERHIRADHPP